MIRRLDPRPPGRASELAERFGTPLYAFDGARMEAEARAFMEAAGPEVTVAYSVKSNPLMGLVARLHRAGCWAEVASGFEYRVARRAGVPGSQMVFNGPLKTPAELRRALEEGATVVADGAEQVREIARLAAHAAPGARIGLRLRPPDRERTDRFGVPARSAPAAASVLRRRPAPHGPPHPPGRLPARAAAARRPADPRRHGAVPGAGVAVRRGRRAPPRDGGAGGRRRMARPGRRLARRGRAGPYLDAVRDALGPDAPPLVLEPGRALIRDAGWLLTRVVARRGPNAVVVDAGITQVPCVLWKRSPVEAAEPRDGDERPRTCSGRCASSTTRSRGRCRSRRCGWATWCGWGRRGPTRWRRRPRSSTSARGRCWWRAAARPCCAPARPTTRPSARRPSRCWWVPWDRRYPHRERDRGPRPPAIGPTAPR